MFFTSFVLFFVQDHTDIYLPWSMLARPSGLVDFDDVESMLIDLGLFSLLFACTSTKQTTFLSIRKHWDTYTRTRLEAFKKKEWVATDWPACLFLFQLVVYLLCCFLLV